MVRRERKLRQSALCQRAYSLPLASRRDINRQIRLRVVREFNLPDSIARVGSTSPSLVNLAQSNLT